MADSDVFSSVGRHPNGVGSSKEKAQSEEDSLLEEFAFSPGFKLFLSSVVGPIALDIRSQLLRSVDISESRRANFVGQLDVLERIFEDLYSRTHGGQVPDALRNFFR